MVVAANSVASEKTWRSVGLQQWRRAVLGSLGLCVLCVVVAVAGGGGNYGGRNVLCARPAVVGLVVVLAVVGGLLGYGCTL